MLKNDLDLYVVHPAGSCLLTTDSSNTPTNEVEMVYDTCMRNTAGGGTYRPCRRS